MITLAINGIPLVRALISLPLDGAWTAEVVPKINTAITGPVVITGEGVSLSGYALPGTSSAISQGLVAVRVVGGHGGLSTRLSAKAYGTVPAKMPITDALLAGREVLSITSSPVVNGMLKAWTRVTGTVGDCLRVIARELGCSWRILPDGTVWFGSELWRPVVIDHKVLSDEPQSGRITIVSDELVFPGTIFLGRKVIKVEHRIEPLQRSIIWFEGADDAATILQNIVRHLTAHVDYYAQYEARVVSQNIDGTLELIPDDARLPGMSRVPIRYGIPGVTATIAPGARVAVEFANGNPGKPRATVWESASVTRLEVTATQIVLNSGTLPVARVTDLAGPYPISSGNVTILG